MNAGIEMDIPKVKEKSLAGEAVQKSEKKGKDKASATSRPIGNFTADRLTYEILHQLILENIPTGSLPTISFDV